jgi:hypothetical protein
MQESPAQIATTIVETAAPHPQAASRLRDDGPGHAAGRVLAGRTNRPRARPGKSLHSREASQAGKKGGATVSADRTHMAEIGSEAAKPRRATESGKPHDAKPSQRRHRRLTPSADRHRPPSTKR